MASDYKRIREGNIREYGEGTRHLSFLGRLYTDRTHFIFELLQNAEDAGASKIRFDLFDDRLEVRHDGRPFNERDVRGICGVDEGTKAEDLTQIGKFGIGFKSVYAYTTAPEVHSGDEHFRIEYYVRPYPASAMDPGNVWTTLFVFPLNVQDADLVICRQEIADRLKGLSARTLLFLRNVGEIEYTLPDKTSGSYLREETRRNPARQVLVIGQNNGQEEDETWLLFERPVSIPASDKTVPVEIGFKLEYSGGKIERIVKVNDSPLVVFFPTEKETRFGFLVQGPYRTTPARDNIPRDDHWNSLLVAETAILVTETLQNLKDMGLLTISLLEALPIRLNLQDYGMFIPIVEVVRLALMEQELLPADDGSYVSARNARMTRSTDLRKLLSHTQLRALLQTNDEIKWLTGEVTRDSTTELFPFLLATLRIDIIDPESFARRLSSNFLCGMDDDWFVGFYGFLLNQEALWRPPRNLKDDPGILRPKTIIRLQDGSLVAPFNASGNPTAYLPGDHGARFASIKREITEHQPALDFLRRLGLTEPDQIAEVFENILPKYRLGEGVAVDEQEYCSDLRAIFGALKTDSIQKRQRLISEAKKTPFIKTTNAASKEVRLRAPDETWLPKEDITLFVEGNPGVWVADPTVAELYQNELVELGIRAAVKLVCRTPGWDGHVQVISSWGWHKRGLDGFDPDTEVEELEFALKHPNLERSLFIWNEILVRYIQQLVGEVQTATRQDFSNGEVSRKYSKLGQQVRTHAWVPTRDLQWKAPHEIEREELHPELRPDEQLLSALGIKTTEAQSVHQTLSDRESHAQSLGIELADLEHLRFIKQHPDEFAKFRDRLETRAVTNSPSEKPSFPGEKSQDREKRDQRLVEQLDAAPNKEYETRERSIRTSRPTIEPSVWLRSRYTNDDQQLVCQICKNVMPFRKRDGEYYFAAVEVLNSDHFSKEHEAQFLALCPVCGAMYEEFVKRDPDAMAQVANSLLASQEPEIPLQLGDLKTSIRFVDIHFGDVKTILTLNGGGGTDHQVSTDESTRWRADDHAS